MMPELNKDDLEALRARGLSEADIKAQVERLKLGTRSPELTAPCTPENGGITLLSESELQSLSKEFDSLREGVSVSRFVPASGAASRMFKSLLNRVQGKANKLSTEFLDQIDKFPFASELRAHVEKELGEWETVLTDQPESVLALLLNEPMRYAQLPKGMIAFHAYDDVPRTAFAEQLYEASWYADSNAESHTHFTIPNNNQELILAHLEETRSELLDSGVVSNFSSSVQFPNTDTVALDENGQLVRTEKGDLLFRPGGHGALIKNLDQMDADLVFIKNIDNVVPDHLKDEALAYKKPLAAMALKLRDQAGEWLNKLDEGDPDLKALLDFIEGNLNVRDVSDHSIENLRSILDRPIRVCGMVKNLGEPGGGPFWTRSKDGTISPQIIEKAQIDLDDADQLEILESSTHFNPVDIVAVLSNSRGHRYELTRYIDPDGAFIAQKSYQGKDIKALEHPGLWNGAMAKWNTVFVEVPLITFNPVKTVNDLLRPTHQAPAAKA